VVRTVRSLKRWLPLGPEGYLAMSAQPQQSFASPFHIGRAADGW
jgi:hypothetical protein